MIADVVIPAHNAAATIEQAIASARAQTRQPRDVLVVADACEDDTASRARALGARVLEIEARSAGAARNAGVQAATAPYVAFLDADDVWLPSWLDAVEQALEAAPGARLLYGGYVEEAPGGRVLRISPSPALEGDVFEPLLARNFIATSACVCPRSALLEAGLFDPTLHNGEDHDLWLRVAARGRVASVSGHHMRYRRVEGSLSRSADRLLRARNDALRVVRRACAVRPVSEPIRRQATASVLRFSAMRLLSQEMTVAARADLRIALEYAPGDPSLWLMSVLSVAPSSWRRASVIVRQRLGLMRKALA